MTVKETKIYDVCSKKPLLIPNQNYRPKSIHFEYAKLVSLGGRPLPGNKTRVQDKDGNIYKFDWIDESVEVN